jgi:hypothetical protein
VVLLNGYTLTRSDTDFPHTAFNSIPIRRCSFRNTRAANFIRVA